jgi:hypothetical protein
MPTLPDSVTNDAKPSLAAGIGGSYRPGSIKAVCVDETPHAEGEGIASPRVKIVMVPG